MKNVSPALLTLLSTAGATPVPACDLLTVTLNDGTSLYLCNADKDITWNSQVYSSGGGNMVFSRTKTSSKIGVEVAELDFTIAATTGYLIEGVPALQFIRNSGLDGARVRLDRLFLSDWNTPVGVVNNFLGRVSELDVTRSAAQIKAKSMVVLMDIQLPKNTYQPTCLHSLYDTGCTLSRSAYASTGSVTAVNGQMQVIAANAQFTNGNFAAGYFTQGYVQFNSGPNAGQRRTVLGYQNGVFTLGMPLLYTPKVGDAFTAYAGCDHTSATCAAKFNNLSNFRGFEFIPVPETAL